MPPSFPSGDFTAIANSFVTRILTNIARVAGVFPVAHSYFGPAVLPL